MLVLYILLLLALWALAAETAHRVGRYLPILAEIDHPFAKHLRAGYWLSIAAFACLYLLALLLLAPSLLRSLGISYEVAAPFLMAARYAPLLLLCGVPLLGFRAYLQGSLELWEDAWALEQHRAEALAHDPAPFLRNPRGRAWRWPWRGRLGGRPARVSAGTGHPTTDGTLYHGRWYHIGRVGPGAGHRSVHRGSTGRGNPGGGSSRSGGGGAVFSGGQTSGAGAGRSFASAGAGRASGGSASSGSSGGGSSRGGGGGAVFSGGQTSGAGAGRSFASASNQRAAAAGAVVASRPSAGGKSGKSSGKSKSRSTGSGKSAGGGAAALLVLLARVLVWLVLVGGAFGLGWVTTRAWARRAGGLGDVYEEIRRGYQP